MQNTGVSPAREPFPLPLRWALLGPLGAFVAIWFLALLAKDSQQGQFFGGLWLLTSAAAGLVQLIAVPWALVLLVRDAPRYITMGNIMMVLAAALPLVFLLLVALLFSGALGTFHI